ncbi:MAG: NAD(P)-dependent oxidoreductase [Clostridium sp.]|nr:NAD(P)-dependent oxidoreductase [Clostridium sp.]
MNNYIITGATGFIGSNLVRVLLKNNSKITIITRKNSDYSKILDIKDKLNIYEYNGDIIELVNLFNLINPDLVIHLASSFILNHRLDEIDKLIDSNIRFGTQILEAMKLSNCKKIINTSSYYQHYNNEIYNPVNLYAATKQAFEDIIYYYSSEYNIKSITLELFDTYGENDSRPKILNLLNNYANSKKALDMSLGEQILDITYIDDIVSAYLKTIQLISIKEDNIPDKYSLISENRIKLKDLVRLYEQVTNKKINVNLGAKPYRNRQIMNPWDKGKHLPQWQARISISEGIKKCFLPK